jgi:hypothetical protein
VAAAAAELAAAEAEQAWATAEADAAAVHSHPEEAPSCFAPCYAAGEDCKVFVVQHWLGSTLGAEHLHLENLDGEQGDVVHPCGGMQASAEGSACSFVHDGVTVVGCESSAQPRRPGRKARKRAAVAAAAAAAAAGVKDLAVPPEVCAAAAAAGSQAPARAAFVELQSLARGLVAGGEACHKLKVLEMARSMLPFLASAQEAAIVLEIELALA